MYFSFWILWILLISHIRGWKWKGPQALSLWQGPQGALAMTGETSSSIGRHRDLRERWLTQGPQQVMATTGISEAMDKSGTTGTNLKPLIWIMALHWEMYWSVLVKFVCYRTNSDSDLTVSTNKLMRWIRCVSWERQTKCVVAPGQVWLAEMHNEKTWILRIFKNIVICFCKLTHIHLLPVLYSTYIYSKTHTCTILLLPVIYNLYL